LVTQKNPFFALDVFESFHKDNPSSFFCFLGEGKLKDQLIESAKKRGLEKSVIFAGAQPNPEAFYSAFDFLVLPSFYEGFGMAALEGQANGLYCLVSPNFPDDVYFSDRILQLPIGKKDAVAWSMKLAKLPADSKRGTNILDTIRLKGYDIRDAAKDLERYYCSLANNTVVKN
jgi:glycosyltransferase involved in cell wall biosynthesis